MATPRSRTLKAIAAGPVPAADAAEFCQPQEGTTPTAPVEPYDPGALVRVEVVDKQRTTRQAPTKTLTTKSNLFAALDDLLRGHNTANGQIEFECDQAFLDALVAQSKGGLAPPDNPWKPGHLATYMGVPVIVTDKP